MLEIFLKSLAMLPRVQRRRVLPLMLMMTLMALMEALGTISILPFIIVASSSWPPKNGGLIDQAYALTGRMDKYPFLILLGVASAILLVAANSIKAFTTWSIQRFIQMTGQMLSQRLLGIYLAKPYSYFLTRHSAQLISSVQSEVQQVMSGVLQPALIGLSRAIIVVFLFALILVSDPFLALIVAVVLGGSYTLIFFTVRRFLHRIGEDRLQANRECFHLISEAFSGVKEIKLRGLEDVYAARYRQPSLRLARHQAAVQVVAQLPRYGLEVIAFGGILAVVLYLMMTRQGFSSAMPIIAMYAFAGIRLLPTLQEVFRNMAEIRFNSSPLNALHQELAGTPEVEHVPAVREAVDIPFEKEIWLRSVDFHYPAGDRPTLHNINLTIAKGTRVGFIGPTGSGKSTTVDLILGLLTPSQGQILVDGKSLDSISAIRGWQSQIGYVPQHIFLADNTIAANIAFGVPEDNLDTDMVRKAAKAAQLHEFISSELPHGYESRVGEQGIRLSGGQRQRLGLARALYGDPAVLVLDEATSALDMATEEAVMSALDNIGSECTIIMIAHRLSTVRRCDVLFKLEGGRLAATGTYEEVVDTEIPAS